MTGVFNAVGGDVPAFGGGGQLGSGRRPAQPLPLAPLLMFGPGPLAYMAAASKFREAVHRPLGGHGGMVVTGQAGQGLRWVSGAFPPSDLVLFGLNRKHFPHIVS